MNHRTLRTLAAVALIGVGLAACDDDDMTGPMMAEVSISEFALDFGQLDPAFGASLAQTVTVTNDGSQAASLGAPSIAGSAAGDFAVIQGDVGGTLAGGASREISIAWDPSQTGARTAQLIVSVEGGDDLTVNLSGTATVQSHVQVDRMGIPALNTVFNHPPQFSKTDYNTAKPVDDVATYTGLFETVLGAVANPDPAATADLLLPDALPVSLGASTSAFASLTGRDLTDDAVDVALMVTVGVEALHSDNVDSNDKAFLSEFPYLAPPHD